MKGLIDLFCNDKTFVIFAVWSAMICAMVIGAYNGSAYDQIVTNGFSGLFGIAVGQRLNQNPT